MKYRVKLIETATGNLIDQHEYQEDIEDLKSELFEDIKPIGEVTKEEVLEELNADFKAFSSSYPTEHNGKPISRKKAFELYNIIVEEIN